MYRNNFKTRSIPTKRKLLKVIRENQINLNPGIEKVVQD